MSTFARRAHELWLLARFEQAEAEYRKALVENSDDPALVAQVSSCLSERGRYAEGLAEARRAIALDPGRSFGHAALAKVLLFQRRYRAALRSIREAIRISPEDTGFREILCLVLLDLRRYAALVKEAEAGIAIGGGVHADTELLITLRGMALAYQGRYRLAHQALHVALQLRPENELAHEALGWWYWKKKRPERAAHHLREALRIAPDFERALRLLRRVDRILQPPGRRRAPVPRRRRMPTATA